MCIRDRRQGKSVPPNQEYTGELQCIWDEGEIDCPLIMRQLKDQNYDGYICFEYEMDPWLALVDVMTETIKMRDVVFAELN